MSDKPGMAPGGGDDAGSIVALLDRVAGLMDSVQAAQQRMEERQLELENTVKTIQSDVVKLTNDHANTSSTVDRLLEKTRKVSRHIKDVRVRVENQNVRVKKVEATQGDLLAKNKFRVVIYQVRLRRPVLWLLNRFPGLSGLQQKHDTVQNPQENSTEFNKIVL